jgi:hypothetical protein
MATDSGYSDMYPGAHVEYSFNIQDVTFGPFTITLSGRRVTEVRFKQLERDDRRENNCTMMLMLGPVASIDEADRIADDVKEQLLEIFSLIVVCRVGRARRVGHNLVPRPGEGGQMHGILPAERMSDSGHSEPRSLTNDDIKELRTAFSRYVSIKQTSLLRIFRHAMDNDDVVARFLMLYLILYLLRSNQREVDNLIRSIDPNVDETPDPRNLGEMETCYTRLRNEITHRDVDHESTRQELSRRIQSLTNIVCTAIRQEYNI